jgi:4-diphosphocytidyl-2-C-methyl-D-erythritol kinase
VTRRLGARAPAKINLSLRVGGVRPDGYHELRTVFQALALHDTLTFAAEPGPFRIACADPACPTDRTNLVWRAAEHLWRAAGLRGRPRDMCVSIAKRIPMRAGLGGGSSNAAAAIRAFNQLWRADLSPCDLHDVASRLGADVPFFLEGGTALGVERGDLLLPLRKVQTTWVVIVVQPFGVSTSDAFEWFDRSGPGHAPARSGPAGWSIPPGEARNDLQHAVVLRHPRIGRAIRALVGAGSSYAAMSGSGSAVFGLFSSRPAARAAAVALAKVGRAVLVTRTVRDGVRLL